jgi:predicted aspartyl protease
MKIRLQEGLPYVSAKLVYRGEQLFLDDVLLDTGSAGTILSAEKTQGVGLHYEPNDLVHRIRGVGGAEFVFGKQVDVLTVGDLEVHDLQVEIGAMDYGLNLDGIIGVDFLVRADAVINLAQLELYEAAS